MTLIRRLLPACLFAVLACLFLWKVVFAGQVFVPAHLLRYLAPWTAEPRPPWNPLMYDSVGQFYPWRHFAGETVRGGMLPLWNPYQFCGTPFVANSQSAVFYPGNLLFYLLPTAQAAGWNVILHLTMAATFTFVFLRGLGLSRPAAFLGGAAYVLSTWQVSWLHLPTFLCTSAWLPLVLHFTLRLRRAPNLRDACLLALCIGMTLLAGHLQIAFYVLLAAAILALWPGAGSACPHPETPDDSRPPHVPVSASALRVPRFAASWLAALLLGGLIAAPQVLPSLELSRRSHRTAPASAEGYKSYVGYSVGPAGLVTLYAPDFFGNPSDPDRPYAGRARNGTPFNYAEGAMYVGIPTLLLAALGLLDARRRSPVVRFAAGLALFSMLMALGTVVDALFYFYVPGFAQSGSPGRSLVLWAFALSVLAAFGCDAAVRGRLRTRGLAGSTALAVTGLALTLAAALASGEGGEGWPGAVGRAVALLSATAAGVFYLSRTAGKGGSHHRWLAALPATLVVADLFSVGMRYNPTSPPDDVYPATPLIRDLQARAGHDRIMPINPGNFSFSGPSALLPPNGAMVYGLRDVQGYDSLFSGRFKAFMDRLADPVATDSSPLQVGNMVFAKNPASSLVPLTGAKLLISREDLSIEGATKSYSEGLYIHELASAPGRAHVAGGSARWLKDESTRLEIEVAAASPTTLILADQAYPGWTASVNGQPTAIRTVDSVFRHVPVPAGTHRVAFEFRPTSFRVGLYLCLAALAACAGCLVAHRRRHTSGAA